MTIRLAPSTRRIPERLSTVDAQMTVRGCSVEAAAGARYTVFSPATGEPVGTAPLAGAEDIDRAVSAAKAAAELWRAERVEVRAVILERALDAVSDHGEGLAKLLTLEQGKPLCEAREEVATFILRMKAFINVARNTPDGHVPRVPTGRVHHDRPLGHQGSVTAALVAWNFPIGLLAKKVGPPLLAGGSVIVKPAFTTPLSTLWLVRLMSDAGVPAGILNAVSGHGPDVGAALVINPDVDRVHLTGSDQTGAQVRQAHQSSRAELVLELSGSDPMIVCADADIRRSAAAAFVGRFRNAGQMCIAVKRVFVERSAYEPFVSELSRLVSLLEPADPLLEAVPPAVRIGPLHTRAQRDRLEEQLAGALCVGARVLTGGGRVAPAGCEHGHYFAPTLVAHERVRSPLLTDEVFGPVLPIVQAADLQDAISLADRGCWELNASIWTRDGAVRSQASRLRCRQLWINRLPLGFGLDHERVPAAS